MAFPGIYFFSSSLEKGGLARKCLAGFMLPEGWVAVRGGGLLGDKRDQRPGEAREVFFIWAGGGYLGEGE